MNDAFESTLSVALDLGSTHISAVAGRPSAIGKETGGAEEGLHVMGSARVACSGLKRGIMLSLDSVTEGILDAIDEIERQTGMTVESARVAVSSPSALSDNATETVSVRNHEIKAGDLERLHSAMRAAKAPQGFEFLHRVEGAYAIDSKQGIVNPLGMWGENLSAAYHRVAFPHAELQNLARACNQAGLRVERFVFEPLAAAAAVLDDDERELGVCSVDIGAELTHLSVYVGGQVALTRVLPLGAHHITKDLAVGLRTTQAEAERIKRAAGIYSDKSGLDGSETFSLRSLDGTARLVSRKEATTIVEPRVREILHAIQNELRRFKLAQQLTRGLVLSGGGALLSGLSTAAEAYTGLPARIGMPLHLSGVVEGLRSPQEATVVGALAFDLEGLRRTELRPRGGIAEILPEAARKIWERIREPFA